MIIESTAVSITTALLSELSKEKIKVIFCDEKRNPSSELISYYGAHDTSEKIRNQIKWSEDTKKAVWTEIVTEKIKKQAKHLLDCGRLESELLQEYIMQIQFGDVTNREGHAAKVYFNALFGMDFSRSQENSINAMLNYGYSIICSLFSREIVSNGYITQIGVHHDNMFNQFNLSCDLMEPFRILVDRKVKNLMPQKFEKEEKKIILELLQDTVTIAGREENISNAIKIYCKSVVDAMNEKDVSLIKFYKDEL